MATVDIWRCNICGSDFYDDGSMHCPFCESMDIAEAMKADVYQEEWKEDNGQNQKP